MVSNRSILVTPGEHLCHSSEFTAGKGVYVKDGSFFASTSGRVNIHHQGDGDRDVISVESSFVSRQREVPGYAAITLGSVVLCRVKFLTGAQCKVDIICIQGKPLRSSYRGVIYIEDIRLAFDPDFSKAYNSFRLGDILLGRVAGVIDNRGSRERTLFHVVTCENELGVVFARSSADKNTFLIPLSWKEMLCPVTGNRELRKVAKVVVHKT